jgi:hypothetical protein
MLKLLSSSEVEKLGPYELVGQLASGGMATVYLARRAGLGGFSRYFAIKRLRPELSKAPAFLAMLIDEARLAARIHHPNVAATLEFSDAGEAACASPLGDQGQFYLVMEYVEGGSLLDLVTRSNAKSEVLPPKVVVRIVLDALAGLHAAHELSDDQGKPIDLIHRDLSPHNLMVGLDGCTRVVDFGLARAASRLTKTAVGTLKGKLAYMAPEQLHQRPIDRRADLFSVGVVLWEGLSGERLFRAETDVGTIERVLRGEIPSLRTALPWLSPALESVVLKALSRDPDARFQTAEEMSLALSEAAELVGLVGSRREVGACVARLLGEDLADRREALRGWIDARGVVETPSNTQLAFAGLATSSWAEEATPDADTRVSRPTDRDDPVAAVRGSVIGGPAGVSIAPTSSSPPARARARRSLLPLVLGAAVGLGAVGLALIARSGAGLPLLGGEDVVAASPAAPLPAPASHDARLGIDPDLLGEAPVLDARDEAPPAIDENLAASVRQLREAQEREAAEAQEADASAKPASDAAPKSDKTQREPSAATVDAQPEKKKVTARPRPTPTRRASPKRPSAAAPPTKSEATPAPSAKQKDLDNPYR